MLFLGAISYGQTAYVAEYETSDGTRIYTHRRTGNRNTNICSTGFLRHYSVSTLTHPNIGDVLNFDPSTFNTLDNVYYHWVSPADKTAFVADMLDGRDNATDANPNYVQRYYNRDGSLSFEGPVGCAENYLSPRAYFEAQPNYVRTDGDTYFFGPRGDVRIESINGSFVIRFGGGLSETFTDAGESYARLQELYAYSDFEQDLIARRFVPSNHHTYEWERFCDGEWDWRVDIVGSRINLWSLATSTALDLSMSTAIERIDSRPCVEAEVIIPHEIRGFREIDSPTRGKERYQLSYAWNQDEDARIVIEVRDDITGDKVRDDIITNRSDIGREELQSGSVSFDVDVPNPGHRYRFSVRITEGEGDAPSRVFHGDVNANQNIIIKDWGQQYVRFWTTSNISNNDDRVNVRAIHIFGTQVSHSSYGGWKTVTPNRVLAGGFTKEYIYEHSGRRRVENFETIEINAQRNGQGEFTRQRTVQGPQPRLRFRLGRNNQSNVKNSEWRIRADWTLNLPPQWDMSQISNIQTTAYSDEYAGWVREDSNSLSIDVTRHPSRGTNFRNTDMWRFSDNSWEFTLTFIRTEPRSGRRERYTIRYHSTDYIVRPAPGRTTDRYFQYKGGVPESVGGYFLQSSSSSHWSQPEFPNSRLEGQRN